MKIFLSYLLLLVLWGISLSANTQGIGSASDLVRLTTGDVPDSNYQVIVRNIIIKGNRRTKKETILRELTFYVNKQYGISKLNKKFNESKKFLINTGLFHTVSISLDSVKNRNAIVQITVQERWSIVPTPIVKEAAGSTESMRRINYGLRFTHRNITGRNDRLHLSFMTGFNQQVAFQYEGIYLDKDLKWSAAIGASYGKSHSLMYATINNKGLVFSRDDGYVQSFFRPGIKITYRPAIKTKHTFGIGFNFEKIADTIAELNPSYANGLESYKFPELSYTLTYTDVDFLPYPLKGFMGEASVIKRGLGGDFNLWQIIAKSSYTWPLSQKYFFNIRTAGTLKLPFSQPYIMQPVLGYSDLSLQGYESYAFDGTAGAYVKAIFLRQLMNKTIHIPNEKIKQLNSFPLRIYAKVFGNTGYIYHPEAGLNQLNNKLLYSGGIGVDIFTLTDFVLKIQWSFNQLDGNGLSLSKRSYY
ncbi:MAG: hypothetical protein ICV66_00850 [Chitinophagaceae bacterium]|nr:hypothetical protein [Chitinophagaceae bacterium]